MAPRPILILAAAALAALALAGAGTRPLLAQLSGGLWEVTGEGQPPRRICIDHVPMLAQVEHPSARCIRTVLRNDPASAIVEYRCAGGGFGHSEMTLITPRSVRIETQGIADHAPFHYVVQARRLGACPPH